MSRFFPKSKSRNRNTPRAAGSEDGGVCRKHGHRKTAQTTKKTAEASARQRIAQRSERNRVLVARHWKGIAIVGGIFLGGAADFRAAILFALFSGGGGAGPLPLMKRRTQIFAPPEAAYCGMEAELQNYLDTYESTHDYDEYHFDLDGIEHDPYVLISILSAWHNGTWTIERGRREHCKCCLRSNILTETVETETRARKPHRYHRPGNRRSDDGVNTNTRLRCPTPITSAP